MEHSSWLGGTLVYLAAAVLAVPLARLLGLGSIIGYLAAGIVIGPFGLKLVGEPGEVLHFAEFGVVLMLFLVGLELEPKRLWAMRRPIFGGGSFQLLGSTALIVAVGMAFGIAWPVALVAALGLAMSSTAIGLAVLSERNLMPTAAGQTVLSVMLLQDIAAIPILALVPLLASAVNGSATPAHDGHGWSGALQAIGVIAAVVLGGRLLLRPALRWIAGSRTPEIFTAAALLLVVAVAALMQAVGMSMALGAFLAGVLLAESEYRRELETDIEPFKGLMLGLFFIAVGMSIDFGVVLQNPWVVAGIVVAFLLAKALVLAALARVASIPAADQPVFGILLAQGGEFGFVVFQTAAAGGVIDARASSILVAAVAISMLLTPLLLLVADKWWAPRFAVAQRKRSGLKELSEPQNAPVIIAGFGRYGQIVGRTLFANGIDATVLEHDVDAIESVRRFGYTAFYGDATRLDLLRIAGAGQARVIVVALDDVDASLKLVDIVREHFPQLQVVARARNVRHLYQLRERGVTMLDREIFESSLMSARRVMEALGWQPHHARTMAQRFRRANLDLIEQAAPHFKDEGRLISITRDGRRQLEELWARERAQAVDRRYRMGLHAPGSDDADGAAGGADEGEGAVAADRPSSTTVGPHAAPARSDEAAGR